MKKQVGIKDRRYYLEAAILVCATIVFNIGTFHIFRRSFMLWFLCTEIIFLVFIIGMIYTISKFMKKKALSFIHLKNKVEELEIILKNIPAGVIGVDKTGGITFLNKKAEAIVECKESDVLGKWLGEVLFLYDQNGGEILDLFKRVRSIKETISFSDTTAGPRSGRKYKINGYICPVNYSVVTGAILVFYDQAGEQEKEYYSDSKTDLFKTRYEILNYALSNLPLGVLITDARTSEVLFANKMFRKIHDIPKTVPVTKKTLFKILLHNLEYRQLLASYCPKPQDGQQELLWSDMHIISANGESRIISINKQAAGETDFNILTFLNKSDVFQSRKFTREMNSDYTQVLANSTDGLAIIDERGVINKWNEAMTDLTGIDKSFALGRPIWEIESRTGFQAEEKCVDEKRLEFIREISRNGIYDNDNHSKRTQNIRICNVQNHKTYALKVNSSIYTIDNSRRMVKIYRNISGSANLENRLRYDRRFIKRLLNAAITMIYIYNMDEKKFVFISCSHPEYKTEEIISPGSELSQNIRIYSDDMISVREHTEGLRKKKDLKVCSILYRVVFDDKCRWILRRDMIYSRFSDGTVKEIMGSIIDITETIGSEKIKNNTK